MRIITIEDVRDIYLKVIQRGLSFITSKFTFNPEKRIKSSFNDIQIEAANWWIIPAIRDRWNKLITGSPDVTYEEYISKEFFKSKEKLKMVSIGSGVCSHELRLAELNPHWDIICIDFSDKLLNKAKDIAKVKQLNNIHFIVENIFNYHLPGNFYDMVFFHASLHHFKNISVFMRDIVLPTLKPNGKLIINEYVGVNRLQYSRSQLKAINECLQLIEPKCRTMYKSRLKKNRYYGSGLLRMIISDPSECIDAENILPVIHDNFKTILEVSLGGNILMSALKDISHHFLDMDADKSKNLERAIQFEEEFLKANQSDFVFGIYEKA